MRNLAEKKSNKKKKNNSNKRALLIIAAIVIVLAIILLAKSCDGRNGDNPGGSGNSGVINSGDGEQSGPVNPFTGESGYPEAAVGKRPVALMINNAPPARPQWGLCTPDIVFEGLVEGGASRMLWVYANPEDVPEKVGSMRSARHDFLEIAEGMDSIFVHWGGSIYAYDAIKSRNPDHIDGIYIGSYAHRDNQRAVAIEHRGYMVGSELRKLIADKGFRTETAGGVASPFGFAVSSRVPEGGACKQVKTSFSNYYSHTFKYDEASGLYTNYMGETPMTQDGGKQMQVKNVIILYTPTSKMGDSLGCIDMDLTGGSGLYISNGGYEVITWKKGNTPSSPLKIMTEDGKELKVNTGKSWIGLIPKTRESSTVISETVSAAQ